MSQSQTPSTKPTILVPEKISEEGLAYLRDTCIIDQKLGLSASDLADIIHTYDGLIVRSETKVTAQLLAQAKSLRVVARAGVGVDNIDVTAATKYGVIVINSPSGNIGAAAEHTIALLLSMARNIPQAVASLKGGKWERSKMVGVEVKGKILGVIGLGKVGLNVSRMAIGLGMKVIGVDPYTSAEIASANNVTLTELPDVLSSCDFLTIHTPLIASTRGMISTAELSSMKPGSRILNVARGGMIDEAALLEALERGHIAGAGLDVFSTEPPEKEGISEKLIAHPKVIATPHLGASTVEAQENVAKDVCEQVRDILNGGMPRAAVNAPIILPDEYRRLQPYVKLVEKMGHLYTQHFKKHRQTFDLIYEGDIANINTKPLFASLIKGLTKSISEQTTTVNIVNAAVIARERGLVVNEMQVRTVGNQTSYSSLVTLRAHRSPNTTEAPTPSDAEDHVVSGYCSGGEEIIIRLGKFSTSFRPEGALLICHNFDSPGKIGNVGMLLGSADVNINYMSVAPATYGDGDRLVRKDKNGLGEALMILGVSRAVEGDVLKRLSEQEGILTALSIEL